MSTNYLLQYDQIVAFIEEYGNFYNKVFMRALRRNMFSPFMSWRDSRKMLREVRPLTSKNTDQFRKVLKTGASHEDQKSPYYQILMSDYILDALASEAEHRFPEFEFGRLKTIYEIKKEHLTRNNVTKQMIGLVLATGTILLRSIPESIVARFMDYAEFELIVFSGTLILVIGYAVLLLPAWSQFNNANSKIGLIGDLLTYLALMQNEKPARKLQRNSERSKQK